MIGCNALNGRNGSSIKCVSGAFFVPQVKTEEGEVRFRLEVLKHKDRLLASIDVNYVLSITFVVGRTTRKSSSRSFYVPFTPLLRLQHVQEIPPHSKLKAHP